MSDFLKEKELLLESIEKNTRDHWKDYYKDVCLDCIYDDLVIDINEIKRLTEENEQLKDTIDNIRKSITKLIYRCRFEEDFCEEDIELQKMLSMLGDV